ncbi:hypothetical protein [Chromobacterium alticapitis]|uniref:hypothetical protein n=1 Tax=Chromobacterium alticapitis TaxID=2073169 RepID=UPI0011B053F7|nr:hypothetical protein [Chromobacterium alticapitis]
MMVITCLVWIGPAGVAWNIAVELLMFRHASNRVLALISLGLNLNSDADHFKTRLARILWIA